jgi:hypothetical protein
MIGDRRVDVDGVNVLVFENVGVALVSPLHAVGLANLVELVFRPLADGDEFSVRMPLVDRNELGTEAETDDGGANATRRRWHGDVDSPENDVKNAVSPSATPPSMRRRTALLRFPRRPECLPSCRRPGDASSGATYGFVALDRFYRSAWTD